MKYRSEYNASVHLNYLNEMSIKGHDLEASIGYREGPSESDAVGDMPSQEEIESLSKDAITAIEKIKEKLIEGSRSYQEMEKFINYLNNLKDGVFDNDFDNDEDFGDEP